jgi:hypothetical protein
MVDYRLIYVKKRDFSVRVELPERDSTAVFAVNNDDTYIERNGDIYIDRNNDTYVAHNTTTTYPRIIAKKKRNFTVNTVKQ